MPTMTICPATDPLMIAFSAWHESAEYANTRRWALKPDHVDGSLWAAFEAGFKAATERATNLHEQVDSASDAERIENLPGAGAMGAVIEYRDKIRETIVA